MMKTWTKVAAVTVLCAVPAMALGRVIWPPAEGAHAPTGAQLPFFIGLSAIEGIALGLGVSLLLFGFGAVRRAAGSSPRAWAAQLSLAWLLVSWWPHDNLHAHIGDDMQALLYLEYGFHVTLMVAGAVLAYLFLTMALRAGEAGGDAGAVDAAAPARVR